MQVDLNCDMGEGIGNDAAIMPFISSANIACGYHAGNHTTMHETVLLAIQHGVSIGAHPSYPDKENFGRKALNLSMKEIYELTLYQIGALSAIAHANGAILKHVKPHGALYNAAATSKEISEAIVMAVYNYDPRLTLYGLANSATTQAAKTKGILFKHEVFADRTYQPDGTLTSRTQPNAMIEGVEDSQKQVMQMLISRSITSVDGSIIPIQADTICIHGDGVHAVDFARSLNKKLIEAGIQIKA